MNAITEDTDRRSMKADGQCRWFLMCHNHAVTTLTHPILGNVPICDRCLHKTMMMTNLETYERPYDLAHIVYRLMYDHNSHTDSEAQMEDPLDGIEAWSIPLGDLMCIHGRWNLVSAMDEQHDSGYAEPGVVYDDEMDEMTIVGDNGIVNVAWIYKRS